MTDTFKLLRNYVERNDEQAFAQLVNDHINLVYSAALRRVNGDAHLAQDIAQSVFTDLARKAKGFSGDVALSGWLYQHTCFTAAKMLRGEMRRKIREQQAMDMNVLNEESDAAWKQIAPVLEDAMSHLGTRDRDAVVLRYFEQQPLREVGAALGISEDAARMRVDRAVGKLRASLVRRGVAVSTVALAGVVSSQAVSAAPVGIATQVATAALTSATAAGTGTTFGFLKVLSATKAKVIVGGVLLSGVAALVLLPSKDPPPYNPALARQMIQAIFNSATKPLPAKMRFVAEVEIDQKPWTEKQILDAVLRQEDEEYQRNEKIVGLREEDFKKWSKQMQENRKRDQEKLRQLRMDSLRSTHSKTKTFIEQEWKSGRLWRLDKTETSRKPASVRALEKPLLSNVNYNETLIEMRDPTFSNVSLVRIDHLNHLAYQRSDSASWFHENFWEAATMHSEIAAGIVLATVDDGFFAKLSKAQPRTDDSFAGAKLNATKLENLVSGKDGRWFVETDGATLNGRKMSVLRLKGRAASLAHDIEIVFFADAKNLTNLHRLELLKMPFKKTPLISIRDDFDANGFPRTWIVETPAGTGPEEILKKTVKFKEVELDAQFDNKTVFLPQIPADYTINGRKPLPAQDKK